MICSFEAFLPFVLLSSVTISGTERAWLGHNDAEEFESSG